MRSAWDTWTAACAPGPPGKSSQNGMPGGPSSAVALSTTGDDRVDLSEGSGGAANGFMVGSCTSPSKSASVRSCPAHPASLSRSTLIRHEVSDPLERHATTAAWAYPAVRPRITLKKKQLTSRPSSAVSGSSRRSAPQSASCTRATATSSRRRTEAARCSATAADRLSQAPEKFIGPLNAIISGTRGHGTRQPGDFSKLTVVQEAAAETQDVRGSCNHAGDRWDNLDASLLKAEIIKLELEANKKITEQNNRIRRLRDTVGALADGFWRELQRRAMAKAFDKWRRYAALAVISVIPYMQDGLECATPDNSSQASAELWSAERGSQPAELHVSLPSSPCQEPVHADHGMPATMATAGQLGGATCKGRQRRAGVGRGSHGSQGMAHNRTLRVGPPLQVSKQNTQPMPEKVPCQPAAKPRRSRGRHELVWYGDVPSSGSPSKTF